MIIDRVTVSYKELRSGLNFTNRAVEVTLSATLQTGETPEFVKDRLYACAKNAVERKLDDEDIYPKSFNEMEIPF